mgnify:CR=1 FL=1
MHAAARNQTNTSEPGRPTLTLPIGSRLVPVPTLQTLQSDRTWTWVTEPVVVVVVPRECWMDISNAARASSKKISRQRVSHTQKYLARHAPQPPIESLMSLLLKTPVDERLSLTHRQTRLTANTSALDHSHVAATASVSLACCPRSSNTIPSQSTSRALLLLRRRVSI